MKHYLLLPEDTLSFISEDSGAQALCLLCERTMVIFPAEKMERVCWLKAVAEDRFHAEDCLALTARDTLFDARQEVWVPVSRPDFSEFFAKLQADCPALCKNIPTQEYLRQTCDQTGSHLHKPSHE